MREASHELGAHPNEAQELGDPVLALAPVAGAVVVEGLADDVEQRHARVQGREGVLEDHLHLAAYCAELGALESGHVHDAARLCAEEDLAGGGVYRPDYAPCGGGLAAAGLADDAEGLALVDVEAHAVDGLHLAADAPYQAPAEREELAEVFDLQQRLVSGLALCGQVLSSVAVEEAAHVVVG